jgi:hypothetical protein
MKTSSFITLVKKDFPKWSRENIREVLNSVQSLILCTVPLEQLRMIDPSTGKNPILTTTAGVLSYDVTTVNGLPFNAWRTSRISTQEDCTSESAVEFENQDASYGVANKIIFKEDPGTADYYITCYKKPADIITESVELLLPEQFHIYELFEGVCGIIERSENSGVSNRWDRFYNELLPRVRASFNDGSRRIKKMISRRGF